ncbi:hypothetical protein [Mucilaginibacter pedocola]|uniref:Uncharacterized protein n=1 Tax=Mucilaginibacter pedocola TaxID=1792845 RepID=A0A1S9PAX5_9SPHI|nr:hypothetical protein [Mucilaginibacter pedocola]OOQ58136.1 hypothetical protein BC343_10825 [Mucilaginibacter pedocola]
MKLLLSFMELLILFTAPIIQLVLSVRRLSGRTRLPLWSIVIITYASGILCTSLAGYIMSIRLSASGFRCGVPMVGGIFFGGFITVVVTPVIGIIFFFISQSKKKRAVTLNS